ncbi:dihydrolipoyl dehydrogenase [Pseudooceanicola nanhaiensis]|uniref:dihydrolipoyl dehydrogenase n=1 Tax=Pseudooceanicola nanhaiensis TaxID=375761 RepID=UPI001CD3146E|nr:dihydrolipoyl dehydrogenase [Pseudooceanicola nanhaiensis]MCA0920392.1 dihydrolipoyl dehydrogenase [Pseudooceanicola nanhaiensis]
MQHDCDVAVIGAGTAGLSAESHARKHGARTLLIDPDFKGTTCAHDGCMPSKLLIAAADAAHGARSAGFLGIHAEPRIDGPAVLARVRRLRDDFAGGVRKSIARLPEGVTLKGRAAFAGPGELVLDTGDRVTARAVVIATGSAPFVPPPYRVAGDRLLTNENVFELEDLPESLGVIGAGIIGLELAQAFARLGVRVAVFDAATAYAGLPDATGSVLREALEREFPLHMGVKPEVTLEASGVRLAWEGRSDIFDKILVATGRPPNLKGLDLEKAGVAVSSKGVPLFDPDTLQCGDSPIFIAGDANGARPLLHEASAEGTIAGRNAALYPEVASRRQKVALAVTFTRPDCATVGALPEDGDPDIVTGTVDYADQGRARTMGEAHGLLRIHARRTDGRLTGADLVAPGGEHLAHLLAWAIECGMSAGQVLEMPFYHPTLEEGLRSALRDVCRQLSEPAPWHRSTLRDPGD